MILRRPLENGRVAIDAPFDVEWGRAARRLGGSPCRVAGQSMFAFPASVLDAVDVALVQVFGVPGVDREAPRVPAVRVRLTRDRVGKGGAAHLYGYALAVGMGRNVKQYPGAGVSLLEGEAGTFGTNLNWSCFVASGAVVELRQFPAAYLEALRADEGVEVREVADAQAFEDAVAAALEVLRSAGFAVDELRLRAALTLPG